MAQSRLEKIGTIYTRITSLLKGKALREEDTPVWLAIYEAFPPKYEPRYDRRLPKKPVRPIFYQEDEIRARFHKDLSFIPAVNLANETVKSATQNFISTYEAIKKEEKQEGEELNANIYERTMKQYLSEVEARKEDKLSKES